MTSITRIVTYRQEHPYDTLEQIGSYFKVSRQYIHKVLKQTQTPTKRVKKQHVQYCLVCNLPSSTRVCKGNCYFSYYNIKVNCANCRIPFYRKRGVIINQYNRGYEKIYCSRRCYYRGKREGLS